MVTYSPRRARKDAENREEKLIQLRANIGHQAPAKKFMKSSERKFLLVSNQEYVQLNEDAIIEAARWVGLSAIVTNRDNPQTDTAILNQYRELWSIEDCFRTQKSDLKVRPVYHWADRSGFNPFCGFAS